MLDLGLTRDEERAYLGALRDSHMVRITVALANAHEKIEESLTAPQSFVLDGSIQVDTSADVTRSLSLSLLDPHNKLGFIPNSAGQSSLYADRLTAVEYGVYVDDLEDWVDVPVFFGPITHFEHAGGLLSLEAQGKERLALAPHTAIQGYMIQRKTRLDDAIRRVMHHAGEERFSLPKLPHKLHRSRAVQPQAEPWKILDGGENDANGKRIPGLIEIGDRERHAFYDGRGRMAVRPKHKNAVTTFGPATMTEEPQVSYDLLEFRNYVKVVGQKAKGAKHKVSGVAVLPRRHPLSPGALARNGRPRYLVHFVETELKTNKECQERAEKILEAKAKEGMEISFSCLPVPHLEEYDMIRVRLDGYNLELPLKQFSIPLTTDAPMTVGSNRRIPGRRRWRKQRKTEYARR